MKRESGLFSNENDVSAKSGKGVAIWLSALPRVSSFTKGRLLMGGLSAAFFHAGFTYRERLFRKGPPKIARSSGGQHIFRQQA